MQARELNQFGIPPGATMKLAQRLMGQAAKTGLGKAALRSTLAALAAKPGEYINDPHFGELAATLVQARSEAARGYGGGQGYANAMMNPVPWRRWGSDVDAAATEQMERACRLPVAVAGALMPDAHLGYGLPIGGVLATRNAVIPYAVGVDIACRMKMTVLDLPVAFLDRERRKERLARTLREETRFGVGSSFKEDDRREHGVMDEDWSISPVTKSYRDKARSQLGTSGSGNHFVEFGTLTLNEAELGLEAGTYVALLSHSGSRGTGAAVADHYSKLAQELHRELPKELAHLAWLDLAGEAGQEYWHAMELMGLYAAANHALIHQHVAENLGAAVLAGVENHHNFAWKEVHRGEELIVHRKGATPAGEGVLGVIPGSMGAPGYVVRGRGEPASLLSASHGAGRRMSRKAAIAKFNWSDVKKFLEQRDVTLLSAGLDECPMAYKDIDEVMAAQKDLVKTIARFDPRLVIMAPAGERPED